MENYLSIDGSDSDRPNDEDNRPGSALFSDAYDDLVNRSDSKTVNHKYEPSVGELEVIAQSASDVAKAIIAEGGRLSKQVGELLGTNPYFGRIMAGANSILESENSDYKLHFTNALHCINPPPDWMCHTMVVSGFYTTQNGRIVDRLQVRPVGLPKLR